MVDQPANGALSSSQRTRLRWHEVQMRKANSINKNKLACLDLPKASYIIVMFDNFSWFMSQRWNFHSFVPHSTQSANGNNPVRISTESPELAKNHKCISSPQNYSRNLMANHLHPLPGRSGSHCRKLRKRQQLHFEAKLSVRPVSFFFLIPLPQPCRKKSIFTHVFLFTLSKKAGNLQAAHDRRKQMENFLERLYRKDENNC